MMLRVLYNRHAILSLSLLFSQQLIVASSTLWIVLLVQDVTLGHSFTINLILFILSLTLPYIPGLLSGVQLEWWRQKARQSYVNSFIVANCGATSVWNTPDFRNSRIALLAQESGEVLNEFLAHLYDFISTGMNVLFNILAVIVVVDYRFSVAYLISLCISLTFVRNTSSLVSRAASTTQKARIELTSVLLKGWDNIIIGNQYNLLIWEKLCQKRLDTLQQAAVHEALIKLSASTLTAFLSISPVLALLVFLFVTYSTNSVFLATLVATLPRQILVINHIYIVVEYANAWNALSTKLQGLSEALKPPIYSDLSKRISWRDITVESEKEIVNLSAVESIQSVFTNFVPGRFTIRGDNGVGKSTLLLLLKCKMSKESFLFPVESQLEFKTETAILSSGQARKAKLREISIAKDVRALLLDEWDANLDITSIKAISAVLDELSKQLCVIEVRHRRD